MDARSRKSNDLLRRQRLERFWTLNDVADRLYQLCEGEEKGRGDINASMISGWEHGKHQPGLFWQKKLCQLYDKDAIALGFLDPPAFPASDEASQAVQEVVVPEEDVKNGGDVNRREGFATPIPTSFVASAAFLPATVREQTHALDFLLTSPERSSEQQAGIWLTLGANSLGQLFDEGWTVENVLHALEIVLQGVQAMPAISRRRLIQLGVAAVASSISLPIDEKHVSEEDRVQLTNALSESIATAWKLFHTAGNAQMLAVGQAQLFLVQQNHALLYPSVRPFLYTGAYGLIGISLHFQERDEEALRAHQSGYIAALTAGHPWYVSQSLICQSDCYHALGQYHLAIQTIEEALRIIGTPTDEAQICAKAHLLTCWADNAMMLQDYTIAQEKLEASTAYLDYIVPNEEFDRASWLLLTGKYALITKNYEKAARSFEEALAELPLQWTLRRAMTAIGLSKAYARMEEREKSLTIAESLIPMVEAINARMTNRWFREYLQQDLLNIFPTDDRVQQFVTDTYQKLPWLAAIPVTTK